ncbi:TPA: hypothetical protein ACYZ1G_003718 [Escherichia coli]
MNIYAIDNKKLNKEESESLVNVRLTSTFDGGVTANFKFNDNINGGDYYQELFSIQSPRAKDSENVIKEIMKHGIKLTVEEHTMINSFINKTGDRLVYSVVGYELSGFSDEEKKGVAMVVISRGGVATVFAFGNVVQCTQKTSNVYVTRIKENSYCRYNLALVSTDENSVELSDVKSYIFPIDVEGNLGKTVFQFYVTKPKVPSCLEDHDHQVNVYKANLEAIKAKEKAEREEQDRPRKEAETYAKLVLGRFNNMKTKVKNAKTWEDAIKFYHQANVLLVEVEEARDKWASLDQKYAQRRAVATLQPIDELCKLPKPTIKPEVKKHRPTLRLVA